MNEEISRVPATGEERPFVLTDTSEGIGTVRLNRPEKRNVLSTEMLLALKGALQSFVDDREVRAIIIAAEGAVFSSGHNIKELVGVAQNDMDDLFALSSEIMQGLQKLPQPVIAMVDGLASAAGCHLVASCDLVVASAGSRFQTPGVKIGLFCSTPMIPLSRVVPPKKAMEMLLTGEPIGAEDAERAGLVNRVVPAASIEEETRKLAKQIIQYSAFTIGLGKRAFYEQLPQDIPRAYEIGKEAITRNALAPDGQEGMNAFLEKRQPRWKE